MAENLTDDQRRAVYDRGGNLLISAAAGSGKTKVLVDRIMSYILSENDPANIDDFLIITYTKSAAAELRGKIAKRLSELIAEQPDNRHLQRQVQRLYLTQISTVHAFCSSVLRENLYQLDIPADFRQAEENECGQMQQLVINQVLDRAYENIDHDAEFKAFVNSQGFGRNDQGLSNVILSIYHQSMNFISPDAWMDRCLQFMDLEDCTDVGQTLWGKFLMESLMEQLPMCAQMIEKAHLHAQTMRGSATIEAALAETKNQIEKLMACKTWDEIVANRVIPYPNFKQYGGGKNAPDPEDKLIVKVLKEETAAICDSLLQYFVDDSATILKELRQLAPAVRGMIRIVKDFSKGYLAEKRRRHLMDYSDLEQLCLELFCGKRRDTVTPLAREIGTRYREVMIDEYQDSNAVQDTIFSALTKDRNNCFMVGDVKQSIYQFRQADPQIFMDKYAAYADAKDAQPGQGRKVLLRENFRSGEEILAAANFVFLKCMTEQVGGLNYDDSVSLKPGKPLAKLDMPVELYGVESASGSEDYADEAAFVAQRITDLVEQKYQIRTKEGFKDVQMEDIAILLRSPKQQLDAFVTALQKKGIPYVVSSDVSLLETQDNLLLHNLLKVLNNPQQDIPLASVMCSYIFGFTANDMAAIRAENRYCSLYDVVCNSKNEKAKAFVALLKQLRQATRSAGVCQVFEEIFVRTQMLSVLSALPDGDNRLENVQAFYQYASDFESHGKKDLGRFLDHLDVLDPAKIKVSVTRQSKGCVTITSIHKSKGLEYPVVFLSAMAYSFSNQYLREKVLNHAQYGFGIAASDPIRMVQYPTVVKRSIQYKTLQENISEEMRVLYVAMTRPKDRLIMTYSSTKLQERLQRLVTLENLGFHDVAVKQTRCAGDWVFLSAIQRTEAGELFALAGPCNKSQVEDDPWLIRVVKPGASEDDGEGGSAGSLGSAEDHASVMEKIRQMKDMSYQHEAATTVPSKMTATKLNASNAEKTKYYWRRIGASVSSGKVYGTAIHEVMANLDLSRCADEADIRSQMQTLAEKGLLQQELADAVDVSQITGFFATALGKKMMSHPQVLREFPFSILEDLGDNDAALHGEKVLLQGVVDCALIDDDGITIIDFKSDKVTEADLKDKVDYYRPQLQTYAKAMSRIFEKPVKEVALYFFRLGKFVPVE